MTEPTLAHEQTSLGPVDLHVVSAGPTDGQLVVLLHGFPETWYAWRDHIPRLAEAGYRVLAPDMRGYGRSAKPAGVESYGLSSLTADVAELVRSTGSDRASLVGHDWGGVVATATASAHPSLLDRLVVLNAPYPGHLAEQFSLGQAVRSWYVALFAVPRVPERLLGADGYRLLRSAFDDAAEGAYSAEDLRTYQTAWARPGALRSMLHYYRAFTRHRALGALRSREPHTAEPVRCPTTVLWGDRDRALGAGVRETFVRQVPNCRVVRYPEGSHWLHREYPGRVGTDLLEALA